MIESLSNRYHTERVASPVFHWGTEYIQYCIVEWHDKLGERRKLKIEVSEMKIDVKKADTNIKWISKHCFS
jgi:hypothetical protein